MVTWHRKTHLPLWFLSPLQWDNQSAQWWASLWFQLYFSAVSVSTGIKLFLKFPSWLTCKRTFCLFVALSRFAVCFRLDLCVSLWFSDCKGSVWWRCHTAVLQLFQLSFSDNLVPNGQRYAAPLHFLHVRCCWSCLILQWSRKWKIWNEI